MNLDPDRPPTAVVLQGICVIVIKLEAGKLGNGVLDGQHGVLPPIGVVRSPAIEQAVADNSGGWWW